MNTCENTRLKKRQVHFNDNITIFTFEKDNICLQEYLQMHHKCLTEHLQRCYLQKFNSLIDFDICRELELHFIQQMKDEIELDRDPLYSKKPIYNNYDSSDDENT